MCHVTAAAQKLADYAKATDPRATTPEARMALNYLDVFGYLPKELAGWKDISLGDIVNAVAAFQGFFGLPATGHLDAKSVRAMEAQRCGMPDLVREDQPAGVEYMKVKAFAEANLARWTKTGLTYYVDSYVGGLPQTAQDGIIAAAFADWTAVCNLGVTRASTPQADIIIQADRGNRSNFDGPGGVLAWAYLPDGRDNQLLMKFDLDETWTADPAARGVLMKNVATHEIGHLLGLDHSRVQAALMAPYYAVGVGTPQANDDIPRIQARYGTRQGPPQPPPPPPAAGRTLTVSGAFNVFLDGRQVA